ncbi:hypothetical protein FRC03_008989 [Tulasnella sp. 419]|nr:hypothetical protein FRC03_008989 [Tulasnella sp. 419]
MVHPLGTADSASSTHPIGLDRTRTNESKGSSSVRSSGELVTIYSMYSSPDTNADVDDHHQQSRESSCQIQDQLHLSVPLPPSRPQSRPSSRVSSHLSEGEDADSVYVRTTYARLELSGVPGDGYDEGVERTRARNPGVHSNNARRQTIWEPTAQLDELAQKELDTLKNVDRYGFKLSSLSVRQENRLALLPLAPLRKPLRQSRTPPTSPLPSQSDVSSLSTPSELPKERSRIDKWDRMMKVSSRDHGGNAQSWTFDQKKGRKLRQRVYKGIPDRWRAAAWFTLINASTVSQVSAPDSQFPNSSNLTPSDLVQQYREWIDRPSTHDVQIDLDVPRTISGHVMFHTRYGQGQRSLFRVLHSFSLLCSQCGYCQGMGSIAATLLCYLDPERTYACMVRIHDSYDMHAIFSPGFPGLLENIYLQERLVERLLPDVYASFKKHLISSTSFATKWYITLFANTFPFQTQLRLWDAFFMEGRDVIVITAVAIIWVLQGKFIYSLSQCALW